MLCQRAPFIWLAQVRGDPDLLTLRAARLLGQADVLVYDHLVSPGVLELARREAHRIYAGKQHGNHTFSQTDINNLLVRLAKKYQARRQG